MKIESQRVSAVDMMCQARSGERFIVEMQLVKEAGFEKRAQFYASKAYIEQRTSNPKYRDLKEVIFLAIANFQLFPSKTACLSHHHILDTETHQRDLKDFSFSFIELSKFKKKPKQLHNIIDKWLYFLKQADDTNQEELIQIIGSDSIIKRAYDELDRYGWTEDELRAYETAEMHLISYLETIETAKEEGMKEGEARGKAEANLEVAQKMLAEGISRDLIASITGIALKTV